jgi:hypothetical protein
MSTIARPRIRDGNLRNTIRKKNSGGSLSDVLIV